MPMEKEINLASTYLRLKAPQTQATHNDTVNAQFIRQVTKQVSLTLRFNSYAIVIPPGQPKQPVLGI